MQKNEKRAAEATPDKTKTQRHKDSENLIPDKICHALDADYNLVMADDDVNDPYLIDLTKDYPEPDYLLRIGEVCTMPKGDISSVKAKSKNGKSYLESIFVASLLGCEKLNIHAVNQGCRSIYFDTEQNPRNTCRLVRRIHILLNWGVKANYYERFKTFSLRSMPTEERFPYIQKKVRENRPELVIVDGIADLIYDFNDIKQSAEIIDELMKLSTEFNCHVSCVLHTNKANTDNNMKGHLGTMLLQKSSDVYEVKKEGSVFNVTETDSRNLPIEDFSFALDPDGMPIHTDTIRENKEQGRIERIKEVLGQVFNDADKLSYTDIKEKYALYAGESTSTARRRIKDATEHNFIKVSGDKYQLNI
jgi:hypothetical protein